MNKETNSSTERGENDRALRTAMNILAYAECTEKTLRQKLQDKGYSAESAEFAVDYMLKHRYLDEKRYLYRMVEYLGNTKLYGRRRIAVQVKQKGFSAQTLSEHLEAALARIDERENCRRALEKVKKSDPKKTVDALVRRGFLYGDIKAAMSEMHNQE